MEPLTRPCDTDAANGEGLRVLPPVMTRAQVKGPRTGSGGSSTTSSLNRQSRIGRYKKAGYAWVSARYSQTIVAAASAVTSATS